MNTVNFERQVSGAAGKAQQEQNDETLNLQFFPQTEALSCTHRKVRGRKWNPEPESVLLKKSQHRRIVMID